MVRRAKAGAAADEELGEAHVETHVLRATLEWLREERDGLRKQVEQLGGLTLQQLEERRLALESQIAEHGVFLDRQRFEAADAVLALNKQLAEAQLAIVATEDVALLQEAGVYQYHHPLSDAVAYQGALSELQKTSRQ